MESESKMRDSLPADLIYRVTGTGPRAEAAHGKYVRRVLRYLRSRRQVQWLIATEAIARPSAPTPGAIDRSAAENGSDSDSDSGHYSRSADEGNGSTSDDDQADHLIDIRRQLFPNGGTKTADNDSIYPGANNDAPQDLPAAQSAGTGTHPPGSAGAQDAIYPGTNNGMPQDLPAAKGAGTGTHPPGSAGAQDAIYLLRSVKNFLRIWRQWPSADDRAPSQETRPKPPPATLHTHACPLTTAHAYMPTTAAAAGPFMQLTSADVG